MRRSAPGEQNGGSEAALPAASGLALSSAAGRWLLTVSVLGSGMSFLDATAVNLALPSIGRQLHVSISALQWVLDGYLLSLSALILLGGSLSDRYGRRTTFIAGTVLFTLASLGCALAGSAEALVAARIAQGIGGALLTPGSLAMIESGIAATDRGRAIGIWSGLSGVATAFGPLMSGFLVGALSWRAIFLINLPIGAVTVVAAVRKLPDLPLPQAGGRPDFLGALLAALGLGAITIGLIEAPRANGALIGALSTIAGIGALTAFWRVQRSAEHPLLPLDLFASRRFNGANAITFTVYAALGGVLFLLIALLQIALHYSPFEAGAATLPITVLMLLMSPRIGALAQRTGPRPALTTGPALIAVGLVAMAQINPGDSYAAAVLPALLIFGSGLSLVVAPLTATVLAAVPTQRAGIASATNNAVARLAGLLAVAVLPVLANLSGNRFYNPQALTAGFHVAAWICAGLAATGGLIAWLSLGDGDPEVPV